MPTNETDLPPIGPLFIRDIGWCSAECKRFHRGCNFVFVREGIDEEVPVCIPWLREAAAAKRAMDACRVNKWDLIWSFDETTCSVVDADWPVSEPLAQASDPAEALREAAATVKKDRKPKGERT